ncbi:hypothetical protein LzC2_13780 [Planctomycetes bacterium LzC2]|uniref:Uncharacterized protein n=2 Tax=Alienimonas chondri TaxID=2681879 RepID=A0ABX1VC38_9PLAN|nr:hypothetical protein [Alienimonas chondri]
MHFRGGRLTGAGADDCGPFTIRGVYDVARGTAEWTKSYARWDVLYRGFAEDDSIWGTWSLAGGLDGGGFRLWPEKHRRKDASAHTSLNRPKVIGGDVDTSDSFAESFADELEPAEVR